MKSKMKLMSCEQRVPTAAPATPILGRPKRPKIKSQLSVTFTRIPAMEQMSGAFTRSVERRKKFIIITRTVNGAAKPMILRYGIPIRIIASLSV